MGTSSGGIKVKPAFASPTTGTTFEVDESGNMTVQGTITTAKVVTAASVSAASSAAATSFAPRGYIEVWVSGTRVAIPYVSTT